MRFRSPTDAHIRVALTSGHVAIIGEEWQELDPMFHREALAQGAQVDKTQISNAVAPPIAASDGGAAKVHDTETEIHKAIVTMLERDDDGDFVKGSGNPNLKAVEKLVGFRVERDTVYNIFQKMKDD